MKTKNPIAKSLSAAAVTGIISGFVSLSSFSVEPAHASCSSSAGPGVNWEDCRKRNLIMTDFDFTGSNLSRTDMSSSDLRGTTFDKSNLSKANLVRASLAGGSAREANFNGVIAYRTDFSSGNYSGSSFAKAEIIRANFSESVLENNNMSKGEFSRVNFTGAQIGTINFDFSNLARSDFRGSKITGAMTMTGTFLFRTRFEGTDLSQVTGLQPWQLEMACGNAATILPAGVNQPDSWPCVEETE